MNEKLSKEIAVHQTNINELEKLKELILNSISADDIVTFNIVTEHERCYDLGIFKRKTDLNISKRVMYLLIEGAIKKERKHINKIINAEVERRYNDKKRNCL